MGERVEEVWNEPIQGGLQLCVNTHNVEFPFEAFGGLQWPRITLISTQFAVKRYFEARIRLDRPHLGSGGQRVSFA